MITDNKTNFVYFSSILTEDSKYLDFWKRLESILLKNNIPFGLLKNTKDIWCRDYMPVQISEKVFFRYRYYPDYLVKSRKYFGTITDPDPICRELKLNTIASDIILDGGNIIKSTDSVILTVKIFKENPEYVKSDLIEKLKVLLKVRNIFIIPKQPYDLFGHSDGMVRFIDDNTLLINYFHNESDSWKAKINKSINEIGLKKIENFPCEYTKEKNIEKVTKATGIYINYAQIGNNILLPLFNINKDSEAIKSTQEIFPECNIIPIDSTVIADRGGVLNCITWNIRK